jgi:hypothetical protein
MKFIEFNKCFLVPISEIKYVCINIDNENECRIEIFTTQSSGFHEYFGKDKKSANARYHEIKKILEVE